MIRILLFCSLLVLAVLSYQDALFAGEPVAAATDKFYVPGAPGGEVTSGVLPRPQGYNSIAAVWFSPQVVWLKIEQQDYAVPQVGQNPNRVFYDGNPLTSGGVPAIDMNSIGSLRFTVQTSGTERVARAVEFQWQ